MTDQEYQAALQAANDWRYLMTVISTKLIGKRPQLEHCRRTGRSNLDAWLMARYNIDQAEARSISNRSTETVEYHVNFGKVTWVANRPVPTFEDYPELKALLPNGKD